LVWVIWIKLFSICCVKMPVVLTFALNVSTIKTNNVIFFALQWKDDAVF